MIGNVKTKTVGSTGNVEFTNTQRGYYDMIIMIQNTLVNQTITITDTEGNLVTEDPITLSQSAKILIKDVKVGTITFSDPNSYSIIISYTVKQESTGIPYIDIDFTTGNVNLATQAIPLSTYQGSFSFDTTLDLSSIIPDNKMWRIRSIAFDFEASSTTTYYFEISVVPPNNLTDASTAPVTPDLYAYSLFLSTVSVTSGGVYSCLLSLYATSKSSSLNENIYTTVVNLPREILVDGSYQIYIQSYEPSNKTYFTIEYEEVNIS